MMLSRDGLYYCMKHNYNNSSSLCPHCINEVSIKRQEFNNKHDLLTRYSQWLHDCGYIDADWYAEEPNAVDRFLQEETDE